jgi:hypothetical protein
MLKKSFSIFVACLLSMATLFGQQNQSNQPPFYRYYIGSTAVMAFNFMPDPPSYYQLNFGYRITPKDVVSLEAVTLFNNIIIRPTLLMDSLYYLKINNHINQNLLS